MRPDLSYLSLRKLKSNPYDVGVSHIQLVVQKYDPSKLGLWYNHFGTLTANVFTLRTNLGTTT
jgi:hypothetical protein